MNVFVLDRNMVKSAQMLDDSHLKAQINEGCQILMANYNHSLFPETKIGHINHPVTKYYDDYAAKSELICYLVILTREYTKRFNKLHQNELWIAEFSNRVVHHTSDTFRFSKTLVNKVMTDNIEEIRRYIATKPHTRPLKWTGREKPDWWVK